MRDQRKAIVADGYDLIADRYLEWAAQIENDPRHRMLDEYSARLKPGARVLDIGCGAGVPSTQALAARFEVTGLDISAAQIDRARRNVPRARFVVGDVASTEFPARSFDGVTALYSVSHVPREEHPALFKRVGQWLEPGGLFLVTLGADDSPDWTGEWLGRPMFFSSFGAEANRELLNAAGFELLVDEVLDTKEPDGAVSFLWVLARNARAAS
jgi:cyclopropane fatty-acyl-phospholipid synthase-like methyltransferase